MTARLPLDGDPAAVGMGNPHAVFFVPDAEAAPLTTLGPQVEHDPLFPQRTNVEFASLTAPDRLRMRVWERGTGVTLACGSGACATAATTAAYTALLTGEFPDPVRIDLPNDRHPSFALATEHLADGASTVGVVKDAGDDPFGWLPRAERS